MDANILLKFNLKNHQSVIENLLKNKNNSIYSGKSGAIIYLLELYSITNDENLLKETQRIAKIILADFNEYSSYAFFTGNMGVAYSFLQIYNYTSDPKYLNYCLNIAKKSKIHLSLSEFPINDLLTGVSGILLTLLHIYSVDQSNNWVIEDINFYIDYLLDKSYLSNNGNIFWDLTNKINKGLTGFSHGASGIGFVFKELYKLSGNSSFKEIFDSTLEYEDQYYDDTIKNWLDFRKYPYKKGEEFFFEKNAKDENISFFLERKQMFAWCHGAPGIIGIRENVDSEIIGSIITSVMISKNHSLCHSGIGNLLCLMENKTINPQLYKDIVEINCQELIAYYNTHKSLISGYPDLSKDYGLFMGDLGGFYFCLKAYKLLANHTDLDSTPNILYPKIDKKVSITIDKKTFANILKASYPKTVTLIVQKYPNFIFEKKDLKNENLKKKIAILNDEIIDDVFSLESTVNNVQSSIESHSYEFFRNKVDLIFFKSTLNDDSFMNVKIRIKSNTKFCETKYDWNSSTNEKWTLNNVNKIGEYKYAIVPNYKKQIIPLSRIQNYLVDYLIEKDIYIENIILHFYEIIDQSSTNKDLIKEQIINSVTSLIENRILEIIYEKI